MNKFFQDAGNAPFYGLIGKPCRLSLSPLLHTILGKRLGEDIPYFCEEPEENEIPLLLKALKNGPCRGINVTVPYKEKILPLIEKVDPLARAVGAVNTVCFSEEGVSGYNTDVYGFLKELEELGIEPAGLTVLVLGAGGAARAVLYALLSEGASVYLWNRNTEKAEKLVRYFEPYGCEIRAVGMDEIPSLSYQLLVSTLPQEAENAVLSAFKPENVKIPAQVISVAYSGRISPLEGICRLNSVPYADGLSMLFYQGARARELWTGKSFTDEELLSMRSDFSAAASRKLVLLGFMGAGKSTFGKRAAEALGKDFYDLDTEIEKEEGTSISVLFRERGEACFREKETEMLRKLLAKKEPCVIALGGGTPVSPENRRILKDANCLKVWLDCSPSRRKRRLFLSLKRPLARGRKKELETLYQFRVSCYQDTADAHLSTDGSIRKNEAELLKLWKQSLY